MNPARVGPRPSLTPAVPAPPSSVSDSASVSASSFPHRWLHAFALAEWSGRYSVDKLLRLLSYSYSGSPPSPWSRIALVLALTPLPAFFASLLTELLPLHDPSLGWRCNTTFLVRTWLRGSLISFSSDTVLEHYIPSLRLPRYRLLLMNLAQGAVVSVAIVALSAATRVFPVPFTPAATTPVYAICSWLLRFCCDARTRIRRRDAQQEAQEAKVLKRIAGVFNFTTLQLYGYCIFATVFMAVPERWRSLATLMLIGLKAVSTRGEWSLAQTLQGTTHNDCAAVHVAFGAQFFHALFVSVSLQKSTSLATLVAVVVVTAAYDLAILWELRRRTARVTRLPLWSQGHSRLDAITRRDLAVDLDLTTKASVWSGVQPISTPALSEPLSPEEQAYLTAVQQLFQYREATLLRFYVDLFVPLVFYAYVAAMKHLPNGQYVPFVNGNDLSELARRLGVQLGIKLGIFIVLLRSMSSTTGSSTTRSITTNCSSTENSTTRYPSGLEQLAFALESMAPIVHAKSLFTIVFVLDFSLVHFGNDLTFQFQWLRNHHDQGE